MLQAVWPEPGGRRGSLEPLFFEGCRRACARSLGARRGSLEAPFGGCRLQACGRNSGGERRRPQKPSEGPLETLPGARGLQAARSQGGREGVFRTPFRRLQGCRLSTRSPLRSSLGDPGGPPQAPVQIPAGRAPAVVTGVTFGCFLFIVRGKTSCHSVVTGTPLE